MSKIYKRPLAQSLILIRAQTVGSGSRHFSELCLCVSYKLLDTFYSLPPLMW